MKKIDLAYLAGVIDSDGTIGIKKSTYGMRHSNGGQPIYSERISLRQVQPQAADLLHNLFGGSRYLTKPSAKKGKHLHTWVVTDLRAVAVLEGVRPYLRLKASQADNALSLRKIKERSKKARVAKGRGHVGSAVRPVELGVLMEKHYQVAKWLNRTGI